MAKGDFFREIIQLIAPGTSLRAGIDNILSANSGALILLMNEDDIKRWGSILQPGFFVNCAYTPQRLYELAKMDGAVILDEQVERIFYANVQFTPDASIPTSETGMRHRTAERMAKQTGKPTLAISRRRAVVSIFWGAFRYTLNDLNFLFTKVNQALKALEKYSDSYHKAVNILDILEIQNRVTLFDVCKCLEKGIKSLMIGKVVDPSIMEAGENGYLAKMQQEEMLSDIPEELELLVLDYLNVSERLSGEDTDDILTRLSQIGERELRDYNRIAQTLGYNVDGPITELMVVPKGFRLMKSIPKIPRSIIFNLVRTFRDLNGIDQASPEQLRAVEGIGEKRSKAIIEGLTSLRQKANISQSQVSFSVEDT
ncbi:MAG TPA: DNA integrity scanning diadenylate cyclase DisA [Thermotogota bacterium]|nr:DNA integrity scanning diadenylate cyclase DisA [Thermotogota bacterium]HRW91909.1 DNA integrity scanning diadenylate cyclase DisA [Thermotogota bacterium]